MGIAVISVLLLAIWGLQVNLKADSINEDFLSKPHTNAVKGIFVVFIILVHFQQYIPAAEGLINIPFVCVREFVGQLIVTPFLFISGYGIMKAYMRNGQTYLLSFPRKRIFNTLLHFDLGLVLFILANLLLQRNYTLHEYITALVGWNSVGNSNWYIFAILCLYSITFVVGLFLAQNKSECCLAGLTTLGVLIYICLVAFFKKKVFYNTVMCYPAGMYLGIYEDKITQFIRSRVGWLAAIGLMGGVFIVAFLISPIYSIKAVIFPLFIYIVTARFSINNRILIWLGEHTFSIYMLQRLPMNIIEHFAMGKLNVNVYLLLVLLFTIVIATVFDYCMHHLDACLQASPKAIEISSKKNL